MGRWTRAPNGRRIILETQSGTSGSVSRRRFPWLSRQKTEFTENLCRISLAGHIGPFIANPHDSPSFRQFDFALHNQPNSVQWGRPFTRITQEKDCGREVKNRYPWLQS